MILDYLYELPNATNLDDILVQTETSVSGFIPFILAFVFFVVFLGGIIRQKNRTGTADYPAWAVVASISIFILALIMSIIEGLIHLDWLIIIVTITILSGVWLFLDKRQSEV